MLLLTILTLALLAILNYHVGGKLLVYPAFVFSALWTGVLALLTLAGSFFYPVSPETLALLIGGCLAFSVGSWLALAWPWRRKPGRAFPALASDRILTALLLVVLVGFPFYLRWILDLAAGSTANLLFAVRAATLQENSQGVAYSLFFNLATLSLIVAVLAFGERERYPKRALAAIVLAAAMNVLTGAKVGVTGMILALICMDWLKVRHVRWKLVVAMVLLFAVTFSVLTVYVHIGGASEKQSFSDAAVAVGHVFVLYAAGGVVALDRVVRQPQVVPFGLPISASLGFLQKYLGVDRRPPAAPDFVAIGPSLLQQNVYTMYWSYLDLGYAATILIVAFVGFTVTLVYRKALQRNPIAVPLYGYLFGGLLLSSFSEYFFNALNFLVKLCLVAWLVYSLPVLWAGMRKVAGSSVQAKLAGDSRSSR